jgi:2-oxopent-4-enoate/cis-2-oxohex-4-enoate hydratase
MEQSKIQAYGDELYDALRQRRMVEPLTDREPSMTIEDAYAISQRLLERRLADGEQVIGKKIGVTSQAVQSMLNVHQPDFGFLTDAYRRHGLQQRPGPAHQRAAHPGPGRGRDRLHPRPRSRGPGRDQIKIQDTVADNASCGLFVLGDSLVSPHDVDLTTCGMVLEKNGEIIATGAGAAALGSPVNAVAWLANTLGEFGIPLVAGEVILSGSLAPLIPVQAGDSMNMKIGGLGSASVRFV